jgi:ribokinase
MANHIVVVGSLNMDLVARAPRHPQPGETVLGTEFNTFPGGKGANQAVAAARLGGAVKMVGRVGADAFGNRLIGTLASDGVNTKHVEQLADVPTGLALITVDAAGQNTIVVVPGANGRLMPDDLLAVGDIFKGAAALLLQLEIPMPTVVRAIELARQDGVRVILNPAPAQPLEAELLNGVDFLIPNQNELALLAGHGSMRDTARQLQASGVRSIIVTLGQDGALIVDAEGETYVPGRQVQVVDATAAGDAFAGAFVVAIAEGRSTREAVKWGNAAGALAVTRAGAQPSLPTRAELRSFLV